MEKETQDYIDRKIGQTRDFLFGIILVIISFVLEVAIVDEKPEGIWAIFAWSSFIGFMLFAIWLIVKSTFNIKIKKLTK